MNKFITGKRLEEAIYDIIWEAEQTLLIVSPYVKLDDYFKELFDKHTNNPELHLLLVFGKNETEVKKSLSHDDIEYFKKFPNISIVYVPSLHAKYYGNEKKGVITSINLYDYSFKNNIEFGVYSEQKVFNKLLNNNNPDQDAWNMCYEIAEENEAIFIRRPAYKLKKGLLITDKLYIHSETLLDSTKIRYNHLPFKSKKEKIKTINDFPEIIETITSSSDRPKRESGEKTTLLNLGTV